MPSEKSSDEAAGRDEQDEIRRRFAGLEDTPTKGSNDELPPVPTIDIERPGSKTPVSGAVSNSGLLKLGAGRMMGGGGGDDMRSSSQALTIGTSLVGSIVVGTGLGWLVDTYLLHIPSGATPWGLIVGFLIGVASGFITLIRVTSQLNDK